MRQENGVLCIFSLFVIWCVVLIPVIYTLFDWVKSFEKNKSKFLKISRYFAYLIVTALEYMHENLSILTTDLLLEIN